MEVYRIPVTGSASFLVFQDSPGDYDDVSPESIMAIEQIQKTLKIEEF
jgi:hypothetical protein